MIGDWLFIIVVFMDEFTHCLGCPSSVSLSSNYHHQLLLLPVMKPTRCNVHDGSIYLNCLLLLSKFSSLKFLNPSSVIAYPSSCHHLYCCCTFLHTLRTELYKQWCSYIGARNCTSYWSQYVLTRLDDHDNRAKSKKWNYS